MNSHEATLLSIQVNTSMMALARMTDEQQQALEDLTKASVWRHATIYAEASSSWDLPGWVTCQLRRTPDDTPFVVGISPEGSCHS